MEPLMSYPEGTPTNVIEPLDLADVKSFLSIRDDDTSQDPFLQSSITMCRAILERLLPEYIITGTVKASALLRPTILTERTVIYVKGPIRSIKTVTATVFGGESAEVTASILDDSHIIVDLSEFTEAVRVQVTYVVGSSIDYGLRAALLTMIRNRYDRRNEDPYTEEVRRMAYPYMRINI